MRRLRAQTSRRQILAGLAGCSASVAAGEARAASQSGAYGDLKEVELRGSLRPLHPILSGKYGAAPAPQAADPWALVTPDGSIYLLLQNRFYYELRDRHAEPSPLKVRARLFPRSHLLELLRAEPIGRNEIQAKFFCSVCNIYFDEFGPCVCCGEEVQPAAPTPK